MDENGAIESVTWLRSVKLVPLHHSVNRKFVWQQDIHMWFPWPLMGWETLVDSGHQG